MKYSYFGRILGLKGGEGGESGLGETLGLVHICSL